MPLATGLAFLKHHTARSARPEFWIDERTCRACYECDAPFTLVQRKHHCRVCGRGLHSSTLQLKLVLFPAQLEPCLAQETTLHTLNTS